MSLNKTYIRPDENGYSQHFLGWVERFKTICLRACGVRAPFTEAAGKKGWVTPFAHAQRTVEVHQRISLHRFPRNEKPLKIAVLSDFHFGSHTNDIARYQSLVERVNQTDVDLVLLLGDYMNTEFFGGGRIPPQSIAGVLSQFKSRLGTYAILGNHDWIYDGFAVADALREVGITVLENENLRIKTHAGDIGLIGLADDRSRVTDWNAAFAGLEENLPKIIMAHDPASFLEMPDIDSLMVCGHTHGGQIRLPFVGALANSSRAPLAWSRGLNRKKSAQLLVTAGLGTGIVPVRIDCPPEYCVLEVCGHQAND
jgi:predicted MPP superfamily phosphohydrolase